MVTLPETNSSPLKIGGLPLELWRFRTWKPPFLGANMLVLGRVYFCWGGDIGVSPPIFTAQRPLKRRGSRPDWTCSEHLHLLWSTGVMQWSKVDFFSPKKKMGGGMMWVFFPWEIPTSWFQQVDFFLGGGFKYFLFSPGFGEDSRFDPYFSAGLKPPTRFPLDFPQFRYGSWKTRGWFKT